MQEEQMTLGEAADRLYSTRQARYAKQKEVDILQEEETRLKDFIINTMPKTDTGAQGRIARVTIRTEVVPQVVDWERFYKYVSRTRAWEMLQRRVASTAIKERWEAGRKVPGVEQFQKVDVGLNKV